MARDRRRSRSRSPVRNWGRRGWDSRERRRRSPSPRDRRDRDRRRDDRRSSHSTAEDRRSSHSVAEVKPAVVKEEPGTLVFDDVPSETIVPSDVAKALETRRLEEEMQRRRERIEKWRAERKKELAEVAAKTEAEDQAKKWSLEDDEDDEPVGGASQGDIPTGEIMCDEEKKPSLSDLAKETGEIIAEDATEIQAPKKEDEEEMDPLDAYMKEVQKEVKAIRGPGPPQGGIVMGVKRSEDGGGGKGKAPPVIMVTAGAKKSDADVKKKKGELMEQDLDAMEYSSEEEEEDLNATVSGLLLKASTTKTLAKVDHSTVEYEEFRKAFYIEVPEIARMTPEEVADYRAELDGIRVKGKNCPKPIKTWAQCGVSRKVLDILKKSNYEKPTPIQAQAVPAIMSGRDLIGIARTGSGKTLAFLLPLFRHVMDQRPLEEGEGAIAIIMAPTRELVMQIGKECKKFTKSLGIRCVCVYGGTGISEQIADLKRGAEVVVCTPGRMIDILAANNGRVTNLKRITYVVLDEADRMFDMGFEPQVMRIIDNSRPDRQTVMFSATFPRQMEALARRILQRPIEVQVGGRSVVCKDVEQHVVILEEHEKILKLLELLGQFYERGQILVFVETQESADVLLKDLMKHSYPCMALHGGIDQFDRDSTIVDYKNQKFKILIATSVCARGLDVPSLILVVNFDSPNHYEDYVHRCGRTGRAGKKGFAYTFIRDDQERYAGEVLRAMELSEAEVPPELRAIWDKYRAKAAAEGKVVRTGGGFSGKGFKFDESEAQAAQDKKKFQKAALGLQDSDDEDIEEDMDKQIMSILAPKRTIKEVTQLPGGVQQLNSGPGLLGAAPNLAQGGTGPSANPNLHEKLERARRMAEKINMARTLAQQEPQKTVHQLQAEAILKGRIQQAQETSLTAKTVAEKLAEKLNARLHYQPKSHHMDGSGQGSDEEESPEVSATSRIVKRYEEELEINDFPQQVRWKITSKEAISMIADYSEAGITVRGQYYATNQKVPENDRKLYIAIESTDEMAVSKAKKEVMRLIKEELVRLQTYANNPFQKGRYKVLSK